MPTQTSRPNLASTPFRAGGTGSEPRFTTNPVTYGGNRQFASSLNSGPRFDGDGRSVESTKHEALSAFFGQPSKEMRSDPYLDRENENYDLPDAYTGKNSYLSMILVSRITAAEMWPIKELFPWLKWDKSLEVTWDEWLFSDHMLGREPEEAAPRLLVSKFSERRTSMVRYGIGLMLEHGFYRTEKGRLNYIYNLVQISNAVIETAAYGAIFAAVHSVAPKDRNQKYRRSTNRSKSDLDALFQSEHDTWAILQKNAGGALMVVDKVNEAFNHRNPGTFPNYFVWPSGSRKYTQGQADAANWNTDGSRRNAMDEAMAGVTYRESRAFRMGEHEPDEDPCIAERTIGSFNLMSSLPLRGVKPKDYVTAMIDILIYSETADAWAYQEYQGLVRYAGLFEDWDSAVPKLSELGQRYFESYATWGQYTLESLPGTGQSTLEYMIDCIHTRPLEIQQDFRAQAAKWMDTSEEDDGYKVQAQAQKQVFRAHAAKRKDTSDDEDDEDEEQSQAGERPKRIIADTEEQTGVEGGGFKTSSDDVRDALVGRLSPDANQFLREVENLNVRYKTDLFRPLVSYLRSHPDTDIGRYGWAILQHALFDLDLQIAASQPSTHGRGRPYQSTELERAIARGDSDFHDADDRSPHWLPKGHETDVNQVRVHSNPHFTHSTPLEFASQSFTLSSEFFVLFDLDKDDLDRLVSKNGVLDTDIKTVKDSRLKNDVIRSGRLQVSVAASAVLALLRSGGDDSDVAVVRQIRSILARKHFRTHAENDLTEAVTTVLQFPALNSQRCISSVTSALRELIKNYYSNPRITDREIIEHVYRIEACTSDLSSSAPGTGFRFESPADTRAEAFRVTATATATVLSKEKKEEIVAESVKVVKALSAGVDKRNADPNSKATVVNSFSNERFARQYEDIYIRSHPTPTEFNQFAQIGQSIAEYLTDRRKRVEVLQRYFQLAREHPLGVSSSSFSSSKDVKTTVDSLEALIKADAGVAIQLADAGVPSSWERLTEQQYASITTLDADSFREFGSVSNRRIKDYFAYVRQSGKKIEQFDRDDDFLNVFFDDGEVGDALLKAYKEFNAVSVGASVGVPEVKLSRDVIREILMNLPIRDARFLKWCIRNNVIPPIGLLLTRPHMTYIMGGGFAAVAGGQDAGGSGNTLHGHAAFELSDDTSQMMHHGHFAMYNKSVIWDAAKITHFPNVICKDYVCGNGTRPWDPLNPHHVELYTENRLTRDMFVMPVPMGWKTESNHIDATGEYNSALGAGQDANENSAYASSFIAKEVWGMDNSLKAGCDNESDALPVYNTVCFQAHQFYYNAGQKDYVSVITEKTAWGPCIYPGCGKVRRGVEMLFKPVDYDNTKTVMLVASG
jgi:hypothetical protein